jgi:hypothetical protein
VLRRAFRSGLLVGLIGGAIAAAYKAMQGRGTTEPASATAAPTWTPIPDAEPVVVPPRPAPTAAPARPAPPPRPKVSVADLQEAPAPAPTPAPAKKASTPRPKKPAPWVEPNADGSAPETHPIKAKMASGIFHVPGGFNYARTKPDRCYRDVAAAEADGLRPSKR